MHSFDLDSCSFKEVTAMGAIWGEYFMWIYSTRQLNKLFNTQKNITRVLFDKFRTCIWAIPYPEQNLPSEFYIKEHSV